MQSDFNCNAAKDRGMMERAIPKITQSSRDMRNPINLDLSHTNSMRENSHFHNLALLDNSIKSELSSKVKEIDKGYYPRYILRMIAKMGYCNNNINEIGLFDNLATSCCNKTSQAHSDSQVILESQIKQGDFSAFLIQALQVISYISSICGTTGFCLWCQESLSWYLAHSANRILSESLLQSIHAGTTLGGTGLSNPMKSYANIENNHLKAIKTNDGYLIKGALPWVSNLEYGHVFATIFPVIDDINNKKSFVMGIIRCEEEKGIELGDSIRFSGLDGSATKSVKFKDYIMPNEDCIANPAESILPKITAGFIILQMGMAIGIIHSCLNQMIKANKSHIHINQFLDISLEEIQDSYHELTNKAYMLAKTPYQNNKDYMLEVLSTRLAFSKLALKASNAACLFAGAKGYIRHSTTERLLRESYFVAIVTPSIKHLQKELHDIAQGGGVMKQWRDAMSVI